MPSASSPPLAALTATCVKYQTRTPIVRRLIARFLDQVVALTSQAREGRRNR